MSLGIYQINNMRFVITDTFNENLNDTFYENLQKPYMYSLNLRYLEILYLISTILEIKIFKFIIPKNEGYLNETRQMIKKYTVLFAYHKLVMREVWWLFVGEMIWVVCRLAVLAGERGTTRQHSGYAGLPCNWANKQKQNQFIEMRHVFFMYAICYRNTCKQTKGKLQENSRYFLQTIKKDHYIG